MCQKQEVGDCIFKFNVEKSIALTTIDLSILEQFAKANNYSTVSIGISQVHLKGFEQAIDPINLQFAKKCKFQQSDPKQMKHLLDICEYFKISSLKKLLCTIYASRFCFQYDQSKMSAQLKKNNLTPNPIRDKQLKKMIFSYAQQIGKEILEQFLLKTNAKQQQEEE